MPAKLTHDQIDELAELREQGWTDAKLAERFNVSRSAISWQCLVLGIWGTKGTFRDHGPLIVIRKGREVRRFTPAEDAVLLELAPTTSRKAIARQLKRNQRSVVARLMTLARREEMAA